MGLQRPSVLHNTSSGERTREAAAEEWEEVEVEVKDAEAKSEAKPQAGPVPFNRNGRILGCIANRWWCKNLSTTFVAKLLVV